MFDFAPNTQDKPALYTDLLSAADAVTKGEPDGIANMANVAALLDTTPESLSRQLRRLQDSQIIELAERDRVLLHDVDALMELSAN